jgi:hypothetical protein
MLAIWVGGTAVLAAAAVGGAFWLFRFVTSRRLNAAANAYAVRELARTRWHGPGGDRPPHRAKARAASKRRPAKTRLSPS